MNEIWNDEKYANINRTQEKVEEEVKKMIKK